MFLINNIFFIFFESNLVGNVILPCVRGLGEKGCWGWVEKLLCMFIINMKMWFSWSENCCVFKYGRCNVLHTPISTSNLEISVILYLLE